jgi:hypothetical protein
MVLRSCVLPTKKGTFRGGMPHNVPVDYLASAGGGRSQVQRESSPLNSSAVR